MFNSYIMYQVLTSGQIEDVQNQNSINEKNHH